MNIHREIEKVLVAWPDYEIEKTAGGHYRITLKSGEQQEIVFAPSTPSDWRALPNMRAHLRRAMRELGGETEKKPKRTKKSRPAHRPRPAYSVAQELHTEKAPERRTLQVPAPLEPHQRDVVGMKVYRMTTGDFDHKEKVVRKPKKGSPEHRAMMSEKMKASWAARRKKNKWGSPEWRAQLARNAEKARAAITPETRIKQSEAMKASWARRKAEQAAATAQRKAAQAAQEPRPRVRVPAISVRVPAAASAAPSRVGIARAGRLSRRRRLADA